MTATRLRVRRNAWVSVLAAIMMWSASLAVSGAASSPTMLRRLADDYVYDGETTYCWGARANVSSSDVSEDLIFVRGARSECPLKLHVETGGSPLSTGQKLKVTWTVALAATADTALFEVKDAPALIDKRTRQRATIIHSNVHTCHAGSHCDAFRQGQTDTNATTNQVGNFSSISAATFETNDEVMFTTAGRHVVFAHIIIPGPTLETRYDFAVFTTVSVIASRSDDTAVLAKGSSMVQPGDSTAASATKEEKDTPSSPHGMSKSQIITLSVVGGLLLVLFLVVAIYSRRRESTRVFCVRKPPRDNSELLTTKGSNFCVRGSNLGTRSSDWTELYAVDDMLPSMSPTRGDGDDANAIAILRDSSRTSTPCTTPVAQDRLVADFRSDVARWDERPSASPITPSSSAILLAAIHNADLISSTTPASNDCFVPIELLVLTSPPAPTVCVRAPSPPRRLQSSPPLPSRPRWKAPFRNSGRRKRQQRRSHQPPEDSGDEQERDM